MWDHCVLLYATVWCMQLVGCLISGGAILLYRVILPQLHQPELLNTTSHLNTEYLSHSRTEEHYCRSLCPIFLLALPTLLCNYHVTSIKYTTQPMTLQSLLCQLKNSPRSVFIDFYPLLSSFTITDRQWVEI